MANYQTLKAAINAVIKANGNKEITGTVLNEVLLAMVNSLGAGYQFAGVATPDTTPGTPDQKVFYIASQAGTYTNFGGSVVSDGIAIFKWNGIWTTEILDLSMAGQVQSDWTETDTTKKSYIKHKPNIPPSANVDLVPTEDSPNAVSSGGTYNMIVSTAATLFGNIQDATNVNATLSEDGKIYNDYNAGDIFYIEQDDVRKYRVAYAAGTADAEHPVTINGMLFYYADNASDAIWLSLRIKTVSTEQQSLSSQQKAQARTNIAAVSYEQQSLNAGQQVQAQNNMMGKAYSSVASDHSGLGKVYLDKNNGSLTQAMMQATNTVYVIQYDYTMSGNITVPANCTLEFDGGSLSNGTLVGNNTRMSGKLKGIIDNVYISGTWNVPKISSDFIKTHSTNSLRTVIAFSNKNIYNEIIIEEGIYNFDLEVDNPYNLYSDSTTGLWINENTKLIILGTLTVLPNSLARYRLIETDPTGSNITICGSGLLIGDKEEHDYDSLAETLGTKVISTDAATTPIGAKLYINGNYINGALQASAELVGNVYWVRNDHVGDIYTYYKVITESEGSGYRFAIVNTQEWGYGIALRSDDSCIEGVSIKNFTGDGLVVSGGNNDWPNYHAVKGYIINNCEIYNCRRQGISVVFAERGEISNCRIYNIKGTNPQSCIDIEPDSLYRPEEISVKITNCYFANSKEGVASYIPSDWNVLKGTIEVDNCDFYDIEQNCINTQRVKAINVNNCFADTKSRFFIARNTIVNENSLANINNSRCNTTYSEGIISASGTSVNIVGCYFAGVYLCSKIFPVNCCNNTFNFSEKLTKYNVAQSDNINNVVLSNNIITCKRINFGYLYNSFICNNQFTFTDGSDNAVVVSGNNTFYEKNYIRLSAESTVTVIAIYSNNVSFCNNNIFGETITGSNVYVIRSYVSGSTDGIIVKNNKITVSENKIHSSVKGFLSNDGLSNLGTTAPTVDDTKDKQYTGHTFLNTAEKRFEHLLNNKWLDCNGNTFAKIKGATSQRPNNLIQSDEGYTFYDTSFKTLAIMISPGVWLGADGHTVNKRYGFSAERPTAEYTDAGGNYHYGLVDAYDRGYGFYDKSLDRVIYAKAIDNSNGTIRWANYDGTAISVNRTGTFAERPQLASQWVYIGFKYFCTDRKVDMDSSSPTYMQIITPVSPDTGGMEIIYKGDNVWVDTLGRTVS